jgi:23S rRNA pseudouridine2605 synthase
MPKQNFDKFINVKVKGAKKKEQIKQEKKSAKKEREAYFIEKKRELRAAKKLQEELQQSAHSHPKPDAEVPSKNKQGFKLDKASRKQKGKPVDRKTGRPEQNEPNTKSKRDSGKLDEKTTTASSPANKKQDFNFSPKAGHTKKADGEKRKDKKETQQASYDKKPLKRTYDAGLPYERKPIKKVIVPTAGTVKKAGDKILIEKPSLKTSDNFKKDSKPSNETVTDTVVMPLNKYIAHGGVCSRRDAGELVKAGKVYVNREQITDPGYKVQEGDEVFANGKKVTPQVSLVYILLNKPKDFITTADDPQGRKTVLDIVKSATNERIYPVGRLDRNTSGVLLLTNDGELAQQLTHPSFEVRKIYEAKLDKPLAKADFDKLLTGITLEDGEVHADSLAYADSKDRSIIGIEIHSGRNRVVRRMFEHLGYDVKNLDRVMFANLTKKNVERGKWRFLNDKEVRLLKFFNKSKR